MASPRFLTSKKDGPTLDILRWRSLNGNLPYSVPLPMFYRAICRKTIFSIFSRTFFQIRSVLELQNASNACLQTSDEQSFISLLWPLCRYLQLNLKDRKSGDERDYVSLILVLSKTSDLNPDTIVEASFKLLIYDQEYGRHREHQCKIQITF
jgi:hypothetical protein